MYVCIYIDNQSVKIFAFIDVVSNVCNIDIICFANCLQVSIFVEDINDANLYEKEPKIHYHNWNLS